MLCCFAVNMKHEAVAMAQVMWFLLPPALVVMVSHLAAAAAAAAAVVSSVAAPPVALPGCRSKCGDVEIPYPFGIDIGGAAGKCSFPNASGFSLTCDDSFNPPKLYTGKVEITSISVETGEMRVFTAVSYICYNASDSVESNFENGLLLASPLLISPTKNVFTAIGCSTLAMLKGNTYAGNSIFTGCISSCTSLNTSATDGDQCTGLGCCQTTSIPGNLTRIKLDWNPGNKNSAWQYSPCNYAFVAEKGWYVMLGPKYFTTCVYIKVYRLQAKKDISCDKQFKSFRILFTLSRYNFKRQDLSGKGNHMFSNRVKNGENRTRMVLDWAIRGNGSCQLVSGSTDKRMAPACVSDHSYCLNLDDTHGGGYLCNCSKGYTGNPYITNGCTS